MQQQQKNIIQKLTVDLHFSSVKKDTSSCKLLSNIKEALIFRLESSTSKFQPRLPGILILMVR